MVGTPTLFNATKIDVSVAYCSKVSYLIRSNKSFNKLVYDSQNSKPVWQGVPS